jgi:stearoyl-CoA desaturase (delta-9 desaturase)
MSVHDLADEPRTPLEGDRSANLRSSAPAPKRADRAVTPALPALTASKPAAPAPTLDLAWLESSELPTGTRALAVPQIADVPVAEPALEPEQRPLREANAPRWKRLLRRSWTWLDTWQRETAAPRTGPHRIDWVRAIPFWSLHLCVVALPFVGFSWFALGAAIALYVVRMFAITGFYHRYFSHRAFRTTRPAQFVFAFLGNCSLQRGPLWWAAHHRDHHRDSDGPQDPHSPVRDGFLWSHFGWWTAKHNIPTRIENIRDFARYRELRFLDRFDIFAPVALGALMWGLGHALHVWAPGLGTNGLQLFVYALVSTIVLFHATFTINSLAHVWGTRRFETGDQSRNNAFLALITLGEGWHNNHHHHAHSVRQGIYWWEIDLTWYGIKLLEACGIVWDLRPVPERVYSESKRDRVRGE